MSGEGLKSRFAAFKLLSAVLDKRLMLDQTIDQEESFAHLAKQDKAFAHMLVATTLRRLGQCDALILRAMTHKKLPDPVRLLHVIRLGLVQILFMDVPDHAAVDTSVALAEKLGLNRQKGLVNAVLRTLGANARTWLDERNDPLVNIPHWLQKAWIRDYGADEAKHIAQASLQEASTDITPKDESMTQHWVHSLEGHHLPTGSIRLTKDSKSIPLLPGFGDGMWWVQDAAAALPAKLLNDLRYKNVLDMCAAPGGKTLQLVSYGVNVTALDRSQNRLKILKENLKRMRLDAQVQVECGDGALWTSSQKFDAVLLDAPCSATGTLRRHPDVMHIKSESDVARLCDTQSRLLNHAANLVKEGGTLIYCTCSLQKDEGEYQIDAFLNAHKDFKRDPILPNTLEGIEGFITLEGDLRILPHYLSAHGGIDGFYVARLVKS